MGALDTIRQLASQVQRVRLADLGRDAINQWREFSRQVYRPGQQRAWEEQQRWLDRAQNTWNDEQLAKHLQAADEAGYTADRFGKLDQAAAMVARAKPYDTDLRASFLPGAKAPSGIITYQPPGYYRGDPVADAATYVELLGAAPEAKGAGRVLLRDAGLTSPSNPVVLHSVSDPRTMDFYSARGMGLVPPEEQVGSLLKSDLPIFKIPRGDLLKEKKGGLVKLAGGGLTKYLSSLHGIPPARPAQLYDSAIRAEMEVAPALRAKLLSERPLTEAELERVNGFATYPVKVRPGQDRTYFPGDIQSAITGEGMRRGGLARLKECTCG